MLGPWLTGLIPGAGPYLAPFPLHRDKSAAEKRRQLIQESKFLGGDMEHTHLVKGLDFALLQKVSADITVLRLPCPLPQTHRAGLTAWS